MTSLVEGYGSVGIISVSLGKVSCQKQGVLLHVRGKDEGLMSVVSVGYRD